MDESIAEQRAIKVKARRVREEKDEIKWYHFPTQVIRRDIIRSLILVTAPKFDQVKNIAFKALHKHLKRMKARNEDEIRDTLDRIWKRPEGCGEILAELRKMNEDLDRFEEMLETTET